MALVYDVADKAKGASHFADWLRALRPTTTAAFGPVRLVRIVGHPIGPEAEFLEEALLTGLTSVTEVGTEGVVGLVRVVHAGSLPLLLVNGEHIVGAKQNRIFNSSFLVGPGQSVDLPVSCVERGRWQCSSRAFEASPTTIAARARAAHHRRVGASLSRGHGHHGDQRAVWSDVDQYLLKSGRYSPSAAFDDGFQHRREHADSLLSAFEPVEGQVGIAAVCTGEVVGLDLFGSFDLYTRGWKKVARGLMTEFYDEREAPTEAEAVGLVEAALHSISTCELAQTPACGIGVTVHAHAGPAVFSAIVHDTVLYHASGCTIEDVELGRTSRSPNDV